MYVCMFVCMCVVWSGSRWVSLQEIWRDIQVPVSKCGVPFNSIVFAKVYKHTHRYVHMYRYIYIYINMCVCVLVDVDVDVYVHNSWANHDDLVYYVFACMCICYGCTT